MRLSSGDQGFRSVCARYKGAITAKRTARIQLYFVDQRFAGWRNKRLDNEIQKPPAIYLEPSVEISIDERAAINLCFGNAPDQTESNYVVSCPVCPMPCRCRGSGPFNAHPLSNKLNRGHIAPLTGSILPRMKYVVRGNGGEFWFYDISRKICETVLKKKCNRD